MSKFMQCNISDSNDIKEMVAEIIKEKTGMSVEDFYKKHNLSPSPNPMASIGKTLNKIKDIRVLIRIEY